MAYAIRIRNAYPGNVGRHRHGWVGRWDYYTVEKIDNAHRWVKFESAESYALLHAIKYPHLMTKLEVLCIVVGPRPMDGWRIHFRQEKKEIRYGSVLRPDSGKPGRGVPDGR